jgi:hypothetical protein
MVKLLHDKRRCLLFKGKDTAILVLLCEEK